MIPPETVEPTNLTFWGTVGTVIAGTITTLAVWFSNRHKRSAEEAALSAERSASEAGEFANSSIQRAISRLDSEVVQLRETIRVQADRIEAMRIKEQAMASSIMRLESYVDRLHDIMQSHNIKPPARPVTGEIRSVS